jgi:photosystem II stability/assembly factor-like uncharacterized protein
VNHQLRFPRLLLLSLLLCGAAAPSRAQTAWEWQNPSPAGNTLLDVAWLGQQRVVAVGEAGTLLRTTDAGATWSLLPRPGRFRGDITALSAPSAAVVYAVGDSGTVLKSADAGATWSRSTPAPADRTLRGVAFLDVNTGWVVGDSGLVLATVNGGVTWVAQSSGVSGRLRAVTVRANGRGWICGDNGIVLRTENGGGAWVPLIGTGRRDLYDLEFSTDSIGLAAGESGAVIRTTDAGESWTTLPTGTAKTLRSFTRVDSVTILAAGGIDLGGVLARSSNNGRSWSAVDIEPGRPIHGIVIVPGTQFGWYVGGQGVIAQTLNAGQVWTPQSRGTTEQLQSAAVLDSLRAVAVGQNGTILRTVNGGRAWSGVFTGNSTWLFAVHFADLQRGWAVGENGTILTSPDAGATWQQQSSGVSGEIAAVTAVSPTHAWAGTGNGAVLRTTDGGGTWQNTVIDTNLAIASLAFVSTTDGWAATRTGGIYRTSDGGVTWDSLSTTFFVVQQITFLTDRRGWAAGPRGRIARTTDGGLSWEFSFGLPVRSDFFAVHFADSLLGFVSGAFGVVLKSVNGGRTWVLLENLTRETLYDISFADVRTGWAVGGGGVILATRTGGGGPDVQPPGPDPGVPYQSLPAYPNPVLLENGVVPRLLLQLSSAGQVTIDLVDAIGRKLGRVVDEYRDPAGLSTCPPPAGYEGFQCFDVPIPDHIASGAYFLFITAAGREDVRKIIVLR